MTVLWRAICGEIYPILVLADVWFYKIPSGEGSTGFLEYQRIVGWRPHFGIQQSVKTTHCFGGPEGTSLHNFSNCMKKLLMCEKKIIWLCKHNHLACIHNYLARIHNYLHEYINILQVYIYIYCMFTLLSIHVYILHVYIFILHGYIIKYVCIHYYLAYTYNPRRIYLAVERCILWICPAMIAGYIHTIHLSIAR